MMKIRGSRNRVGMNAVLQTLRRPAVATYCLALVLLAAAGSYVILRSPRVTPPGPPAGAAAATVPAPHPGGATRTPAGGAASASASASTSASRKPKSGSKVIQWMLTYSPGEGEGDPEPGDPLDAYYAFGRQECDTVDHLASRLKEPEKALYAGAGAACSAVFDGHQDRWAAAERSIARVDGSADLACYDRDVYRLLRRLVDAHQQFPDARIVAGHQAKASSAGCPIVTEVVPDHGPMAGGGTVTVYGRNLPASVVVWFGDSAAAPARTRHGSVATVIAPACGQCDPTEPADGPVVVGGSWVTFFPGAGSSWDTVPASKSATTSPSPSISTAPSSP